MAASSPKVALIAGATGRCLSRRIPARQGLHGARDQAPLVVFQHRHPEWHRFHRLLPMLRIARVEWFSFVTYPLAGGLQPWSLISERLARRVLPMERAIEPALGRFVGFRMMLMVEKAMDRGQ
jgi:hypothetical protein